jgi:broad specificity phosphatase PhoE
MRKLILIRHSETNPVPGVTASQWQLTEEGRRRCRTLAERLAPYDLRMIVTSIEAKAVQTGQLVSEILDVPTVTADDLHEHDRSNITPLTLDPQEFRATIARLFANPKTLVYGIETADDAHARFAGAVRRVIDSYPDGNLAIVTHATVLTLFVSRLAGLDPFPFWERLGMPAYVVLLLPDLRLPETVESIQE